MSNSARIVLLCEASYVVTDMLQWRVSSSTGSHLLFGALKGIRSWTAHRIRSKSPYRLDPCCLADLQQQSNTIEASAAGKTLEIEDQDLEAAMAESKRRTAAAIGAPQVLFLSFIMPAVTCIGLSVSSQPSPGLNETV